MTKGGREVKERWADRRRRGAERILRERAVREGVVLRGGEVGRRRSVPEARWEVGAELRWWSGGAAGVGQVKEVIKKRERRGSNEERRVGRRLMMRPSRLPSGWQFNVLFACCPGVQ